VEDSSPHPCRYAMKPKIGELSMELNEIWTSFAERMAEIELFQRAAKDSAKK
jgi:hypothetical protein